MRSTTVRIIHTKGMKEKFQNSILFPIGEPNPFGKYFIGQSYLAPVSKTQVPVYNVTFEPGCRNNWHIHNAKSGGGQMLICIGGRGWYQEEGKAAVALVPGSVINIPAGVKHWHGGSLSGEFAHIAGSIFTDTPGVTWLDRISEDEYKALNNVK